VCVPAVHVALHTKPSGALVQTPHAPPTMVGGGVRQAVGGGGGQAVGGGQPVSEL
jgi:hypothetical protein